MNPAWRYAAVALAAAVMALLWPLTAAISSGDALQVRVAAAAVAAIACALLLLVKGLRSTVWIGIAVLSAAGAVGLLLVHFNALSSCVADYDGRPVIIGREFTPDIAAYITSNPGLSPSDLLLDAGGVPDRVWTAASIRSCRLLVSWAGLAAIPLLAVCAGALISSGRHRFLSAPKEVARVEIGGPAAAPAYDAFISYRHLEPDNSHATEILESLEARGMRLAIDGRDFSPNEHFLSEMERCIKQSRFVLCVVTSRYLDSDHTSEEAIISKTLDLAERRRRLVPLIFERVELPVWLHGLVGVDFTASARVDPLERLASLLAAKSPPA
jgi:TIR domain